MNKNVVRGIHDRIIKTKAMTNNRVISAMFSSSISCRHLNIQSLVPKVDIITAEYADLEILSFSEPWFNRSHTNESLNLSNYQTPFRKDRGPNKSGGGVVLYVNDTLNISRRDDLDFDDLEGIWVQIKINGKDILFRMFYIPLNVPKIYGGNWNPQWKWPCMTINWTTHPLTLASF